MDFDKIAFIYGLFFNFQRRNFSKALKKINSEFSFDGIHEIIDIGCGTGALGSVLTEMGFHVTGIDPSKKMIAVAQKKNREKNIEFLKEDVLKGIPFKDNSFDLAIASYVAHGLTEKERSIMYQEMKRLSRSYIMIYDYNQTRSLLTDVVEKAEGGDYFTFIENVEDELLAHFSELKVIQTDKKAACYIAKIKN